MKIKILWVITLFIFLASSEVNAIGIKQDRADLAKAFYDSYTHEANKEYTKAIDVIRKVYDEDSYEMNLRLGWLYYLAKNYKESMSFYNKAMKILPLSIEAKLGYCMPAYASGNIESVIAQYKEILTIDPNNYYGNYRLGLVYYEREDYQNAHKNFERILNLYPFDYDIMIISAWTFYRMNKVREAKVLFNKALLNRPSDSSALEGLSLIK